MIKKGIKKILRKLNMTKVFTSKNGERYPKGERLDNRKVLRAPGPWTK